MTQTQNLGEGSVKKLILKLALPAVVSQIVNLLYSIIDRIYIGNIDHIGALALTGLGLCVPLITIITAFSALFGQGGAPRAAIAMGQGDTETAEKYLGNCFTSLVCAGAVLIAVLLLFGEQLLFLFGASENTIGYGLEYLNIYCLGTISVLITLGLNAFITTQGFAKYSMLTVIIGAVLNLVLDPIFIFALDMGVKGAAIATVIAQTVSAIWVIKFLTGKQSKLKIRKENLAIQKNVLLPVMALGVSSFVMYGTESLLNISFNVSLFKYGGDMAVGAMTVMASIMNLCFLPLVSISQGAQPIISFNYGAGKYHRVKEAILINCKVSMFFSVAVWIIVQLFPENFVRLFNSDPQLLDIAVWTTQVYLAGVFAFGAQISCQQSFLALGFAKISLFLALLRKVFLLIPLIFILPNFFENKVFAVVVAEPVADILSSLITLTCFIYIMKSKVFDLIENENL